MDQPVEVDLDGAVGDHGGTQDGPPGARDTINANVENVTGGDGADLITGNAVANVLMAGPESIDSWGWPATTRSG